MYFVEFFQKFPIYFDLLLAAAAGIMVFAFVNNILKYRATDSKLVKTNAIWGIVASILMFVFVVLAYFQIWKLALMIFAFIGTIGLFRMGEIKAANKEYKRLTNNNLKNDGK